MGENNTKKEGNGSRFRYNFKRKKMEIEDVNNRKYIVKNIKDFVKHISKYYGSGDSLHEENRYYFLINDELR